MARYTLFRDGELVAVTKSDLVFRAAVSSGTDLSIEGMRITKQEVEAWKEARFLELMTEAVSKGAKTHITAQRKMRQLVNSMNGKPVLGQFKPFTQSKSLNEWLHVVTKAGAPEEKVSTLVNRLWFILTGTQKPWMMTDSGDDGNRGVFLQVLSTLLASPDPLTMVRSMFELEMHKCAALNSVEVPELLKPLFDITSNVDGRGEILTMFLFKDAEWVPGTGKHDVSGTGESVGLWHVKEMIGNKTRMGSNHYATSDACKRLQTLSLVTKGFADPRHDISKSFIDANTEALNKGFGRDFYDVLDDAFRASETSTRGILFYKNDTVIVRYVADTRCVGSTKGDFIIRPVTLH